MNEAKKRTYWACRRGMLELDLFLLKYFERYDNFTEEEKVLFNELLTEPDPDLYAYLMGTKVPDSPKLAALCQAIVAYVRSA